MRLLVIEDEARIANAIKRALELKHYTTDVVTDGDNGLSYAHSDDYDLIILDRMLPGQVDGLEICQQIREAGVTTPVLMLTALGEVDDRVEGLRTGADDYMVKPFAINELIARVEALLRRPRHNLGTVLQVNDLEVDPVTYQAKRGGATLNLPPREIKLLMYLMYHQGQVVSKQQIINHVWDDDTIVVPNTVEVYMGYLRQKIDKAFPARPPLIHTVRGFGYKLGAK